MDYALKLVAKDDPEQLKKQLADQRRMVEETLSSAPDRCAGYIVYPSGSD